MHDDKVWTRMPTGNDSDVTFPTIGHFWWFFKSAVDRDVPLQMIWACPSTVRMLSRHFSVISATFEQNQSCVTARDRTIWTRTPTGYDSDVIFRTIGHFSGDFSSVHWTVTSHSKFQKPQFRPLA